MKKTTMLFVGVVATMWTAAVASAQPVDPRYNGGGYNNNGGYNNGGGYDDRNYDDNGYYDGNVYDAPPPPQAPPSAYAYGGPRPMCPGPDFIWVDGYWDWYGGRYAWRTGYWARRPFAANFWIGPRYSGGRFFSGYWGGGARVNVYNRGPVYRGGYSNNSYRYDNRNYGGGGRGHNDHRDNRNHRR